MLNSFYSKLLRITASMTFGVLSVLCLKFSALSNPVSTDQVRSAEGTAITLANTGVSEAEIISLSSAKEIALDFLDQKEILLEHKGFTSWGSTPSRGKVCYHFEGPESEALFVDIDCISGIVHRFSWSRAAMKDGGQVLSLQQVQKGVIALLSKSGMLESELFLHSAKLYDHGFAGKEYSFRWRRIKNGVEYPFSLRIDANATTGEVTNYLLINHPVLLEELTPKISKDEARELVKTKINLQPNWKWDDTHLIISMPPPNQRLFWRINVQGVVLSDSTVDTGQTATQMIQEFYVDTITGKIVRSQNYPTPHEEVVQIRPPATKPRSIGIVDSWPSWTKRAGKEGLLFKSNRIINSQSIGEGLHNHGSKSPEITKSSILSVNEKGDIATLIALPISPRFFSEDINHRIAFEMRTNVYILDLKTGLIGRTHDDRVWRSSPSWDATGDVLATAGNHFNRSESDNDIFIVKVPKRISYISLEKQINIPLTGLETMPVFSPDGSQIILVQLGRTDSQQGFNTQNSSTKHSLYLANVNVKEFTAGTPQNIMDTMSTPQRIVWFPDNRRVLISYSNNEYDMKNPPEIIDIKNKTRVPLALPVLYDPDFPQGKPLVPHEIAVSPDGKQIAFSALRWSGDPKDDGAILIYTCDLDGKNLKRITPPDDMPFEIYKYSQKGVTALNAWEKLQPKPNLGRPVNPFDVEAHQKQIEEWDKMEKEAKEKADTNP